VEENQEEEGKGEGKMNVHRMGRCLRCGECCLLPMTQKFEKMDVFEALERAKKQLVETSRPLQGLRVHTDHEYVYVTFLHGCEHLVFHGDEAACLLHGSEKPKECEVYPNAIGHMVPGCGYTIVRD
jgi:Fe-S-cluster containining protein